MNIAFNCTQCGKAVVVDELYRGSAVECPHCNKGIVVPRETPRNNPRGSTSRSADVEQEHSSKPQEAVHKNDSNNGGDDSGGIPNSDEEGKRRQRRLEDIYICSNCGEITDDPKKVNGCFRGVLLIFVVPFISVVLASMTPPGFNVICVILGFVSIISGLVTMVKGRRLRCEKCGMENTLILATSPKGRKMMRESKQEYKGQYKEILQELLGKEGVHDEAVTQNTSERLRKIQNLFNQGLISKEEYELQRKRILDSI
jgi:DNA-directed RNA polymerase subunit RPC12/RpoP